ncbi:hypothetical protein SPRG_20347, partial [Saprolegnia parasitica CBS 223.65]
MGCDATVESVAPLFAYKSKNLCIVVSKSHVLFIWNERRMSSTEPCTVVVALTMYCLLWLCPSRSATPRFSRTNWRVDGPSSMSLIKSDDRFSMSSTRRASVEGRSGLGRSDWACSPKILSTRCVPPTYAMSIMLVLLCTVEEAE